MRLLVLLSLLALGAIAKQRPKTAKLVNVQINRCPTPTIYANEHEEETLKNRKSKIVFISSEFEDTVRMPSNESGTIQFFVVGNGSFSVVIQSDKKVLEGVHGRFDITQGSGIITLPFKVLSAVRETFIDFIMDVGIVRKTTTVYVSTMSLEPPRPPSRYSSLIFSEDELETLAVMETTSSSSRPQVNQDVEIPTADVNSSDSIGALKNITNSASSIERLPVPSVETVIRNETEKNSIVLENITFNRISLNKATVYKSSSNIYNNVTISKFEKGQIVFNLKGDGQLTVKIWSLVEETMAAKVMKVVNGYAAFPYNDGIDYVAEDKLIAQIHNDRNEMRTVYLTVRRVE